MTKELKVEVILPAGAARFPNLWVPRRFEQPGKKPGEPKYETGVVFAEKDMKKVEAIYKDAWAKFGLDEDDFKSPFKKDKKDKSIKYLNAHSSAKYKPPVFDAKNKKVLAEFGGGSTIVLDVTLKPYDGFGGGITTYINAVQVLDRKAPGGFSGPRFSEAEGYEAGEDDEEQETGSRFQAQEETAGEEDDHNF